MNVFKQALAISAVMVLASSTNSFSNDISVLENTEAQPEIVAWQEPKTGFSGRIRVGYISIENEVDSESSAVQQTKFFKMKKLAFLALTAMAM